MIFTEKQSQTSSIKASWITLTASTASDGISATKRNVQWTVKRSIPLHLNFHGIYSLVRWLVLLHWSEMESYSVKSHFSIKCQNKFSNYDTRLKYWSSRKFWVCNRTLTARNRKSILRTRRRRCMLKSKIYIPFDERIASNFDCSERTA